MRLSSILSLLILCLMVNFFMGCSYFKKAPPRQQYFYTEFREPTFIVTFSWVSDNEKPIIENFFKNRKEARLLNRNELEPNEDFGYEIWLDQKNTTASWNFFDRFCCGIRIL
jgi:hypothetical protein